MKKVLVALTCLLVLCALIVNPLQILTPRSVLADPNGLSVCVPLEILGNASSDPEGVSPAQIRTAYNLPSTGGQGTIAIITPYDDETILNDSNLFCTQFGLPPLNSTNFEKHNMSPDNGTADLQWMSEDSLDVQWAHAIAPNAKILLVEATGSNNDTGLLLHLLDAIDYARERSDVVAICMCWGWREQVGPFTYHDFPSNTWVVVPFTNESLYDSHFTSPYNATFFAASGDSAQNVSWPACSPNVVGVGGTILTFAANGSVASETVWNNQTATPPQATGGGVSQYETEPSYQVSYGLQGSNGHRGVPDVSYAADPLNGSSFGFPVCVCGYWFPVGGTSAGAPEWAAIKSLGLWSSNERFYAIASHPSYSSYFRDITVGTNGNYNATAGYDFCTGLGSPLTTVFNTAPNTPSICSGNTSGYVCTIYHYFTNSTDPDGDNVTYEFGWGDGTSNSTFGPYASGVNVDAQHGWFSPGTYNVSVRAIDTYNVSSGWSPPLTVNVSQNDAGSGSDAGDNLSSTQFIQTALPPWTGTYYGTLYSSNPVDHYDCYKFPVQNGWSISVSLTVPSASDFDLELYNPSGTRVAYSYNRGDYDESILYDADSTGNWSIRILWVQGAGQYSFSISLTPGGYDNCPKLFVWNGTEYVDYGVIKIHNPSGYDVIREVPIQAGDVGVSNYTAVFRLQEGWLGLNFSESVIDQVKLYAVNSQGKRLLCPLISAQHSRLGNVLAQLLFSDGWKVQTLLLETIDLTFLMPYPTGWVQSYVFVLEGCNMYKE